MDKNRTKSESMLEDSVIHPGLIDRLVAYGLLDPQLSEITKAVLEEHAPGFTPEHMLRGLIPDVQDHNDG